MGTVHAFTITQCNYHYKGRNHRRSVMSQYLILLALIPLSCFELVKLFKCTYRNMIFGFSIGLVVAPVSFALVSFTYVPIIGGFIGLVGLPIHLIHGWLGYACMVGLSLLEPGVAVTATQLTIINVINGLLFAYIYALIGYVLDLRRRNTILQRRNFRKFSY